MPEVGSIFTTIGTQGGGDGFGGGGVAGLRAQGRDDDPDQQRRRHARRAAGLRAQGDGALRDIPGARLQFQGSGGDRVQITLAGDNSERLSETAQTVEQQMRSLPGLDNITSNAALQKPEIVIRPWPDRAAELGLTIRPRPDHDLGLLQGRVVRDAVEPGHGAHLFLDLARRLVEPLRIVAGKRDLDAVAAAALELQPGARNVANQFVALCSNACCAPRVPSTLSI